MLNFVFFDSSILEPNTLSRIEYGALDVKSGFGLLLSSIHLTTGISSPLVHLQTAL